MSPDDQITICYWPGREKNYSRNRVMLSLLRAPGITVRDCSSRIRNPLRYIISFFRFLMAFPRCDIILIGFCGHPLVVAARFFTRKPIIFDSFISLYMTLCLDRGVCKRTSLRGTLARWLDHAACRGADLILCDTHEHITFFSKTYGLDPNRFARLWVGTDETVMFPRTHIREIKRLVHFHGEFQPLHGAEQIIQTAKLLPDVTFRLIGRGQTRSRCEELARSLKLTNVNFMDPVPYETLPDLMAEAEICLGIFGDSVKARSVIPHKVFEAMAMEKPIITADTPAIRELLTDHVGAVLCPAADPHALKDRITFLLNNPDIRARLARGSLIIFQEQCASRHLSAELLKHVRALAQKSKQAQTKTKRTVKTHTT